MSESSCHQANKSTIKFVKILGPSIAIMFEIGTRYDVHYFFGPEPTLQTLVTLLVSATRHPVSTYTPSLLLAYETVTLKEMCYTIFYTYL